MDKLKRIGIALLGCVLAPTLFAQPLNISVTLSPTKAGCIQVEERLEGVSQKNIQLPKQAQRVMVNPDIKVPDSQTAQSQKMRQVHSPHDRLKMSYVLCSHNPRRQLSLPIMEKKLYVLGLDAILALPLQKEDSPLQLDIEYADFPVSFSVLSSFGYQARKQSIKDSLLNIKRSVVALGDFEVDAMRLHTKPLYVATNGSWSYFKEKPSTYLMPMLKAHRSYWQDNTFSHYGILLLKQREPSTPKAFDSQHYYNLIVSLLPNDPIMRSALLHRLSDEMGHAWFSYSFRAPNDNSLSWFFEGFSDYHGLFTALRSNAIGLKAMVDLYNQHLKAYALSPLNTVPLTTLIKHPSTKGHYLEALKIRGHFFAKALHDKDPKAFDKAIKVLHQRFKDGNNAPLSVEEIHQTFNAHFGEKTWKATYKHLQQGNKIKFSRKLFHPYAKLKTVRVMAPSFGFDVRALLERNTIERVKVHSHAYKAGLRNGQKVVDYKLDLHDLNKPVSIYVIKNKKKRKIEFKPDIKRKKIPQYRFG